MALHLIFHSDSLEDCILSADPGDDLVLIGDGVNAQEKLNVTAFILRSDAESQGTMVPSPHKFINTAGLADLTEKHEKIVSWPALSSLAK